MSFVRTDFLSSQFLMEQTTPAKEKNIKADAVSDQPNSTTWQKARTVGLTVLASVVVGAASFLLGMSVIGAIFLAAAFCATLFTIIAATSPKEDDPDLNESDGIELETFKVHPGDKAEDAPQFFPGAQVKKAAEPAITSEKTHSQPKEDENEGIELQTIKVYPDKEAEPATTSEQTHSQPKEAPLPALPKLTPPPAPEPKLITYPVKPSTTLLFDIDALFSLPSPPSPQISTAVEMLSTPVLSPKEENPFDSFSPTPLETALKASKPQIGPEELRDLFKFQKQLEAIVLKHRSSTITPNDLREFEEILAAHPDWINCPQTAQAANGNIHYVQNRQTILHMIAKVGAKGLVPLVQKYGIDFSLLDQYGNTALHWALANAQNSTALEIIRHSPAQALSINDDMDKNTPLHLAIGKGYKDLSFHGQTLSVSNFDLMKELIARGADVNAQNKDGLTLLHLACLRRDLPSIKLLLAHGAKLDSLDNQGRTPLNCIEMGRHEHVQGYIQKHVVYPILLDKQEFERSYAEAIALLTQTTV